MHFLLNSEQMDSICMNILAHLQPSLGSANLCAITKPMESITGVKHFKII